MNPLDKVTIALVLLGFVFAFLVFFLVRRGKLKPEKWPLFLGVFGSVFALFSFFVMGAVQGRNSAILNYLASGILWSLAFGFMGYFSGRIIMRRFQKKK